MNKKFKYSIRIYPNRIIQFSLPLCVKMRLEEFTHMRVRWHENTRRLEFQPTNISDLRSLPIVSVCTFDGFRLCVESNEAALPLNVFPSGVFAAKFFVGDLIRVAIPEPKTTAYFVDDWAPKPGATEPPPPSTGALLKMFGHRG